MPIEPNLGMINPKLGVMESAVSTSSIADALFPQVRQRLLAQLFGQPERSFYANELVRKVGSGIGAVQRELESFSSSGLVTVERRGNQKHYQANPRAPIFDELCGIVRKSFGIVDRLSTALLPLAPRIALAFVYGSAASGQMHAGSDVDVLIVADQLSLEEVFAVLGPLEVELARKVNPTMYTRAEFAKRIEMAHPFLTKVIAGPRLPLLGSVDDFAVA